MPAKKTQPAQSATLRRSPKLAAFVATSAVAGFFVTLIATSLFPADPTLGFGALFAYFALYGVTGCVTLGVVWWLLLERRSRRKAISVRMEKEQS